MKAISLFIAVGLLTTTAIAGSISRGGASFSRSVSTPSPARSIGMSRPNVSPPAKVSPAAPAAPAYSAPTPRTNTYVPPPAPTTAPSGGSNFMSSFGGSFGGSLLGSWIGNSLGSNHAGTTVVNAGGTVAAGAPGAPMVVAPQQSFGSSVWSAFWGILGLVMILALLAAVVCAVRWWYYRDYMQRKGIRARPFAATQFFMDVQQAFARRDESTLRRLLTADFAAQMLQDLPDEPSDSKLRYIRYEELDTSATIRTVSYTADDIADGSKINERWHVVLDPQAGWQLAGIEQNAS